MTEEELRKEFQSKLHKDEDTQKINISTNIDYCQVVDDIKEEPDSIITSISTNINERTCIKEADQVRTIRINKAELINKLGLDNSLLKEPIDEEIELEVTIIGREYPSSFHIY